MKLLNRVLSKSNICGVELSFTSLAVPSIISGWQPFYNSLIQSNDFEKAYATLSSIDFQEESVESNAGISYDQKLIFRFPATDEFRAERIALMQKIKFAKIKLSNGLDFIIGRNDFNQNAKPIIKSKSNQITCEITIESKSIFTSGFTPNFDRYALPVFIPVTLL